MPIPSGVAPEKRPVNRADSLLPSSVVSRDSAKSRAMTHVDGDSYDIKHFRAST